MRVSLGDLLRRPAPDRIRVDPRNQQRHEHDPGDGFEVGEEPPAEERQRAELAEVRADRLVHFREHDRERDEHDPGGQQQAAAPERQREPDEQEARRHQHERNQQDRRPERQTAEVTGGLEPPDERSEEREGSERPATGGSVTREPGAVN